MRSTLFNGVEPLGDYWGGRGAVIHRYYLEEYLRQNASCIRGRCLEFQEDSYTTKYGKANVQTVDIINREADRAESTIVADLTAENDIPSNQFDCIICTYTLHIIFDAEKVVSEMHRILKPGGTLFVSVPDITINYPNFPELWRFTAEGLGALLAKYFGDKSVSVSGFGNSLTAAGELRGLAVSDFSESELTYRDPRYSLVICARAVKQ
ncbi:MAG TPA: SAM-dependent methyltransferase [Gammaproteobacteria bacterium]|nr:SAM-dependent methyltransferase [Gammaproteobacteria bacterium]